LFGALTNLVNPQPLLALGSVAQDGSKGLIASPSSIVARSIAADDEWNANLLKLKKMTCRMELLYKEVLHENPPSSSEPLPRASSSSSAPPPPASSSSFSSSEIGLPSSATVEAMAKLDLLVMPVGKVLPVFKLDKAQKSLEELQSKVKADKVCLQEIEALEKELAVLEKEEQLRLLMLDIDGLMVKTEMTKKINGEALANVQSIVGADVEDLDKLENLSSENIESNQKRADQAEKESPCQDQESLSVSKESQPISTEKAADEAPMIARTRPEAARSVKAASSSSSLSQDKESLSVSHTETKPTSTEKVVDEAPVIAKTKARATRAVKAASSSISSSSITPKNKRKSVADLEASFNQQWNGALKETEELKAEDTKHLPYVVLPADAGSIKGKSVIPGIFSSLGSSVKPNSYDNYENYNRFDGSNSENMPPHNVQPEQASIVPFFYCW